MMMRTHAFSSCESMLAICMLPRVTLLQRQIRNRRQGQNESRVGGVNPESRFTHCCPSIEQTFRSDAERQPDVQVGQLEGEVAAQKRAMDADLRERAAEAERLKAAVEELRSAAGHDVADSEAAIVSLQVLLSTVPGP